MALPLRPSSHPVRITDTPERLPKGLGRFLGKDPLLLAVDGELAYIRIGDGSIVTGRLQPDGSCLVEPLMSPSQTLRPLTREDLMARSRMVPTLADLFRRDLVFWAGVGPLQVPRVCEPQFEEAARAFQLLDGSGGSKATIPLYRERAEVPRGQGHVHFAKFPAFRMAEDEDGYRVDFGHLRRAEDGAWELHNHTHGDLSVNAATYFTNAK